MTSKYEEFGPFQSKLDLGAYLGIWYEMAKLPQPFETGCARATAKYEIYDDRSIDVYNVCYDEDWNVIRGIEGYATVDPVEPGLLTVVFPGVPGQPRPNYIIHETNYVSYALVGSPDRSNLYILSRNQQIKSCCLNRFLDKFYSWGYSTEQVVLNHDVLIQTP